MTVRDPAENRTHDFQKLAQTGLDVRSPFHSTLQKARRRLATGAAEPEANMVGILNNGNEALLWRLHLIRHAKTSIDIQTFIWTHDEVGELVLTELIKAARRGVRVRLIADHFGVPRNLNVVAHLTTVDPNIKIKIYRPPAMALMANPIARTIHMASDFKGANQRMHNKTFIVDGVVGITGGRNYENTYYNQSPRLNYKDRDAVVVGPAATQMLNSFERFWASRHSVASHDLPDVGRAIEKLKSNPIRVVGSKAWIRRISKEADGMSALRNGIATGMRLAGHTEYLSDRPGKNDSPLLTGSGRHTDQLSSRVSSAKEEIVIQSPYLILSRRGARFFRRMHQEQPNLSIVVSTNSLGSTDNLLAYSANVRQRELFVHDLGFQIHEYKPQPADLRRVLPQYDELEHRSREDEPFLCIHGKSIVIDETTTYVGTFNLDPRSENLNTEGGLMVRDPAIARSVKADILRDISPGNSWTMAPILTSDAAALTSKVDNIGRFVEDLLPLDIVPPLNSICAFDLLPGKTAMPPGHSNFYRNYRNVGRWPNQYGKMTDKEIVTRLLHTMVKSATPLF